MGVINMATTNLNIRTDKDVKEKAEKVFNELGLSMSAAINIFLKTAIRENGLPFALKLDVPNRVTVEAIEEGRKLSMDEDAKRYRNIEDLKKAIDDEV